MASGVSPPEEQPCRRLVRAAVTAAVPGLWFGAPDRRSTGNLAIVSNPVFIGNGLWTWPNRLDQDDWFWRKPQP